MQLTPEQLQNETQQNNTRRTVFITHDGITKSLKQWSDKSGVPANTLSRRLNRGWSVEKALNTPTSSCKQEKTG